MNIPTSSRLRILMTLSFGFFCHAPALLNASELGGSGQTFYVAKNGNDREPGTLERPFRTLERARDVVRRIKGRATTSAETVAVILRGGTHYLEHPLVLTSVDGSSGGSSVSYRSYPGETPVLSGGQEVLNWKPATINGRSVWVANVGNQTRPFKELWVNGSRRIQSRFPRTGYFRIGAVPDVSAKTDWLEGQWSFQAIPGDIPSWTGLEGSELVVMNRWVESRLPVSGWKRDSSLFRFGKRSLFRLEKNDPYYLVNVREALNEPGEWFLDSKKGLLYYYSLPDEQIDQLEVVIPRLSQLLLLKGEPEKGEFLTNVHFEGITFAHVEWLLPDTGKIEGTLPGAGGFVQAAVGLPAAIEATGARLCTFEKCTVSHVGTYAIALRRGCSQNTITECTLTDLGGGGVKIGETSMPEVAADMTADNMVVDCDISNGGLVFHSAIGVWIGQSPGNRIIHNRIHDFYYSGISIGWTWGYGPAMATGNIVELNQIHHIGVREDGDGPILSDMGGIYTLGRHTGTVIRQNLFHDIAARVYGGWGIYLDEGTTSILAENNIVYRTSHEGFHQHYGKENVVRNNIFAFGSTYQVRRTRAERHTSFAFENNIVLWERGAMFGGPWRGGEMIFDRNLYWCMNDSASMTDSLTWKGWQRNGFDLHSLLTDPLFRDPKKGDFTLEPKSRAHALGFNPISTARVLDIAPLSKSELARTPAPRRTRLLFNSDGSNILMSYDTLTTRRACERVDALAGTGVTTFLYCPNPGQNLAYPSHVSSMFHFAPRPESLKTRIDTLFRRMNNGIQALLRDSVDPVGLILGRARLRGMEAFLTFRMNELHDVDKPASPLLSPFWRNHPEYRVGGYEGWGAQALNYAIPEVREYFFSILTELCERYDLDGLELDFMRFPYYFPYAADKMVQYADSMSTFVARVRAMTDSLGSRRGRPILLAARVPSSLKGCAYVGLDPAAWCRDDLIDFITEAPFLSTEPDMPLREFRKICGDVPVYAGLEYTIGYRMMTREEMRAVSALFLKDGADGIYLFNYFIWWDDGLAPDLTVISELNSIEKLNRRDKLYTLSGAKYPVPNVSLPSQLPVLLKRGEQRSLYLRTDDSRVPAAVLLRIECESGLEPGDLAVTINGMPLPQGKNPVKPQMFPQKVPYAIPSAKDQLEFAVSPLTLRDRNAIRLSANKDILVEWVYLAVVQE
jgi:parallel beta-helix repeat protein